MIQQTQTLLQSFRTEHPPQPRLQQAWTRLLAIITLASGAFFSAHAQVPTEPAYCQVKTFLKMEAPQTKKEMSTNIARLHTFQVGKIKLAGMGVGNSDVKAVKQLAQDLAPQVPAQSGFCTWYFNDGNKEAQKTFNWQYLNNPSTLETPEAVEEYSRLVGPMFSKSANSFAQCLEDTRYLGLGCNGMKHRGPTVFAMVLAYSGCTPKSATEIANKIWGLNGVPAETRLAITQAAYELGQKESEPALRIRALFENQ